MIKAVAYCRYSSDRQREESIEAQLRCIHEYAKSNDMVISREYIDRAISGTFDEREAFRTMIRDSDRNLFDVVLTHKVDRFARNRYDSAIYKRKLRENGVKVIYVAQPISDGPEGAMMEAMLEGMAEYYSKNLAQEVMKGLKENAYECKFCGGIPPLGYDIDASTKKYIINRTEAAIVTLIFTLYLQGHGYGDIIKELNNKGCVTKIGHKFGKNSIYEILRNEKYTGTYMFNKAAKKINGKFNRHIEKNKTDIIRIEGGMPEIIPCEIWRSVQDIMDSRIRPGRKSSEVYLLSGLLYCGVCGSAMTADTRNMKGRDKVYCYYRCYRNNGKNTCSLQVWSRDDLENVVVNTLKDKLFSGESLNNITEKIYEFYTKSGNGLDGEIRKLRSDLNGINKKLGNLVEAIANGGSEFNTIRAAMSSLETQKEQYVIKIEELDNEKKYTIPTKQQIKDYLQNCANLNSMDRTDLKEFIKERVPRITVYPDHVAFDAVVNMIGCGRPYTTSFTISV